MTTYDDLYFEKVKEVSFTFSKILKEHPRMKNFYYFDWR